jgi:hypothetical protein
MYTEYSPQASVEIAQPIDKTGGVVIHPKWHPSCFIVSREQREGHLTVAKRVAKLLFLISISCAFYALGLESHACPSSWPSPSRPEAESSRLQAKEGRDPAEALSLSQGDDGRAGPDEDDDSSRDNDGPLLQVIPSPLAPLLLAIRSFERLALPVTPWIQGRSALLRRRIFKKP